MTRCLVILICVVDLDEDDSAKAPIAPDLLHSILEPPNIARWHSAPFDDQVCGWIVYLFMHATHTVYRILAVTPSFRLFAFMARHV